MINQVGDYLHASVCAIRVGWTRNRIVKNYSWWRSVSKVPQILLFPLVVLVIFRGNAAVLLYLYTWLRYVDDVLDGDVPMPVGLNDKAMLPAVDQVINSQGKNGIEGFPSYINKSLGKTYRVSQRRGLDIMSSFEEIWFVMRWDVRRRNQQVDRVELVDYAQKQDCAGALIVLRLLKMDDHDVMKKICDCQGYITRRDWYNDRLEDAEQGIINVPLGYDADAWWETESEQLRILRKHQVSDLLATLEITGLWYMRSLNRMTKRQ